MNGQIRSSLALKRKEQLRTTNRTECKKGMFYTIIFMNKIFVQKNQNIISSILASVSCLCYFQGSIVPKATKKWTKVNHNGYRIQHRFPVSFSKDHLTDHAISETVILHYTLR
jgi:hypothetical protein